LGRSRALAPGGVVGVPSPMAVGLPGLPSCGFAVPDSTPEAGLDPKPLLVLAALNLGPCRFTQSAAPVRRRTVVVHPFLVISGCTVNAAHHKREVPSRHEAGAVLIVAKRIKGRDGDGGSGRNSSRGLRARGGWLQASSWDRPGSPGSLGASGGIGGAGVKVVAAPLADRVGAVAECSSSGVRQGPTCTSSLSAWGAAPRLPALPSAGQVIRVAGAIAAGGPKSAPEPPPGWSAGWPRRWHCTAASRGPR